MRIWYLSLLRAAKVQASLRIRAVSPEPLLLAHTSNESRGTFRQKARSLAPLNGWACAVEICHDGMLEDTNSLDGAHTVFATLETKQKKKKKKKKKKKNNLRKNELFQIFQNICEMSGSTTKQTKLSLRTAKTQQPEHPSSLIRAISVRL